MPASTSSAARRWAPPTTSPSPRISTRVILDGVPRISADQRNEARRFITLIDALYEHRCHLVIAADDLPDRLYPGGDGAFDFRRAASRLIEMQSAEYLAEEHLR